MGIYGVLIALAILVFFAYRGWSILILAPLCALIAAALSQQPLLANWTQVFMGAGADFVLRFFPIFLLGALFGKLMEASGSVESIAHFMTEKLGTRRAILALVLAGAFVTYGGVSLFVAFFVLAPMGHAMFRAANIPHRLMPAAIALGTSTFTMSAMPGTPAIQNAIPMPFFGTNAFAAPGLGLIASMIMLGFGLWWLGYAERKARAAGEIYSFVGSPSAEEACEDTIIRERATISHEFDPNEIQRGDHAKKTPVFCAFLPLISVVVINLVLSFFVFPKMQADYLSLEFFGGTTLSAVAGMWSVIIALTAAILIVIALNFKRLTSLRETVDSGVTASALPILSVASLVGFGAVVAGLPAFEEVKIWLLDLEGGPLVSLAVAINVLAALTGSASGGLTIALDALSGTYMEMAASHGIHPELLHRVAVIGAGTLDSLPHNGSIVTLLAVCGATHRESYKDIVVAVILGPVLALVAVILLGSLFGSF